MGLFNFFKGYKTPPPLYHHGEPGKNEWLSPIPGPRDPGGMNRRNVDARVEGEARVKEFYERNSKGLPQFRRRSDIHDIPSEVRPSRGPSRRPQEQLDELMRMGVGGPLHRGDDGPFEIPSRLPPLDFSKRKRDKRRARFAEMMGTGRRDPAIQDHSFGRWDNGLGEGGRPNAGFPDIRDVGRGGPPVPDHSVGRGYNSRGEGGRGQEGGRGPRWPAAGGEASAWNMHD